MEMIESMDPAVRRKYLETLTGLLPRHSRILELGCGSGLPMTRYLVDSNFHLTGLDISEEQLALAVKNVPEADFIHADMTRLCFRKEIFDGVAAFYSVTHVPRAEHAELLSGISRILKQNGLLVITMGSGELSDTVESDWLGKLMFFSHFDGDTNENLVRKAGFEVISAVNEEEIEPDAPVCFRWIVARKTG